MGLQGMIAANLSSLDWRDAPINPDWVLADVHRARVAPLAESADGFSSTAAWDCTAGRFCWHFALDETVHIVAGSVTVTDCCGVSKTLVEGDVALFRAGSIFTWDVPLYVRKLAFLHRPIPRSASFAIRAIGRVARILNRSR